MTMQRRDFLRLNSRAAASLTLGLPLLGCTHVHRVKNNRDHASLRAAISMFERKVPGWLRDEKVPGLSIAIVEDAKIAWRRGFGVKDASQPQPVDTQTMFEAASMSKPVFAYLVLKLCEQGVMNLDTPLTLYTPERFVPDDPRLDLITARHVLSHTTGLPNWRSQEDPLRINFAPGEHWMYSGEGYFYLQSVVTRLIGHARPGECGTFEEKLNVCPTDFADVMTQRLLQPFGMNSSAYMWDDRCARRMARPHDGEGKPLPNKKSTAAAVARYGSTGALLTTPTDYAKFLIEVIAPPGRDKFRLSKESAHEMVRPHIKLDGPYRSSWALGWKIFHTENRDLIFHGGDNDGFHCGAMANVERRCGFVVMTNGDNGSHIINKIVEEDAFHEFMGGRIG
jgi:CubicO group peptidase (beta-lactamase class C family)